MFLQGKTWVMDIIRELLAWLDYIVYSIIKWILYIIFDLATLSTSSDVLNGVYSRIYVILGVYMAFKLSFSFFKYLVNPDAMMDKKQGVAKLFSNVIIMLSALVLIPTILFGTNGGEGLVTRAQRAFLPMLPRILLGVNPSDGKVGADTNSLDKAANDMAVAALGAFFMPAQEIDTVCNSGTLKGTPELKEIHEIIDYSTLTCHRGVVSINTALVTVGHAQYYKYSYTYVVSLIVGIILVFILLGICIDVAKRVFKLIVLEVIAPIPIMSLIDPESASKGAFAAWLHQLIFTFLDIFIKIGILYLVILLIQLIISKGLFTNFPEFSEDPVRAALLLVALIIGLIFFAKEAPKFIKDSLGIKDKGDGGGFMGKMAAAVGGGAAGFAAGALHGDALSGMIAGASEGYNKQPGKESHAFRAGGDRAAQLRTGNDKYKTGFAASLQRMRGGHMGYSVKGLQAAKKRAKDAASNATMFEDAWNEYMNTGNISDAMKNKGFDTRDKLFEAYSDAASEKTQADKDLKSYETGMAQYGFGSRSDGGISGLTYRASRGVHDTVSRGAHSAGRAVMDAANRVPILGAVTRTADSAYQQHRLNGIEEGRANNYDPRTHQTEKVERGQRRESLDNYNRVSPTDPGDPATLQALIREGMNGINGNEHDGHMGPGGNRDGTKS